MNVASVPFPLSEMLSFRQKSPDVDSSLTLPIFFPFSFCIRSLQGHEAPKLMGFYFTSAAVLHPSHEKTTRQEKKRSCYHIKSVIISTEGVKPVACSFFIPRPR